MYFIRFHWFVVRDKSCNPSLISLVVFEEIMSRTVG